MLSCLLVGLACTTERWDLGLVDAHRGISQEPQQGRINMAQKVHIKSQNVAAFLLNGILQLPSNFKS